jgi:hypothetical protein
MNFAISDYQASNKARNQIVKSLSELDNLELAILVREIIFTDEKLAEKLSNYISNELQDEDLRGVTE